MFCIDYEFVLENILRHDFPKDHQEAYQKDKDGDIAFEIAARSLLFSGPLGPLMAAWRMRKGEDAVRAFALSSEPDDAEPHSGLALVRRARCCPTETPNHSQPPGSGWLG